MATRLSIACYLKFQAEAITRQVDTVQQDIFARRGLLSLRKEYIFACQERKIMHRNRSKNLAGNLI